MKNLTRKIGDWTASILVLTGGGMLIWPFSNRYQAAPEWAQEAGINLSFWLRLAAVFLVGGLALFAITKLPDRK